MIKGCASSRTGPCRWIMTITGAQALSFQPAVGSWRNLVGTTFGWLARAAGQASSPVLVQNKPLRPRQALVRPRQVPVLTKQPSQEQQASFRILDLDPSQTLQRFCLGQGIPRRTLCQDALCFVLSLVGRNCRLQAGSIAEFRRVCEAALSSADLSSSSFLCRSTKHHPIR